MSSPLLNFLAPIFAAPGKSSGRRQWPTVFSAKSPQATNVDLSNKADTGLHGLRQRNDQTSLPLLPQRSAIGVFHYDRSLTITRCNPRITAILNVAKPAFLGLDMTTIKDQSILPALRIALAGGIGRYEGRYRSTLSDKELWLSVACTPHLNEIGDIDGGICMFEDISEQILPCHAHSLLHEAAEDTGSVSVFITDKIGAIQISNMSNEPKGSIPDILKPESFAPADYQSLRASLADGKVWRGLFHHQRKNGQFRWEETIVAPITDDTGAVTQLLALRQDISERKLAEARTEFLAQRDPLTGLPNRMLGRDRLEQAMALADRTGSKVALLFLDLDHFKKINDGLGHSFGDKLLQSVANRLQECVRDCDTTSRQSGDEFFILLGQVRDHDPIITVAAKILESLIAPHDIDGTELFTSASIGIAMYPDDGRDYETLLKRSETAMYHAKDMGRNTYRFFAEHMNVDANEYLQIRTGLRRALERNEFVLHYQPQVELEGQRIIGVEALIRWNHPDMGMVSPGRFIPIAEDSGLILPIGEWVVHEACRQAAAWQKAKLPNIVMAVNLSAMQFKRGDLVQSVSDALEQSGLPPHCLELELTESILLSDTSTVLQKVQELKALGVQLSIDDFGTGYSSLSYLKRFQVDKLKIDQSFVRDINSNPNDAAIVRAVVQMARSLGLRTIAEGVEDETTLDALRFQGCDEVQGYLFGKPMPAEQMAKRLEAMKPLSVSAVSSWSALPPPNKLRRKPPSDHHSTGQNGPANRFL